MNELRFLKVMGKIDEDAEAVLLDDMIALLKENSKELNLGEADI